MKITTILFLCTALMLCAQDTLENPTVEQPKFLNSAQVRVDVLMVSVPENEALKLLPTLRDPATIEAAQKAILALIAEKKATLLDWPEVTSHDRKQAVTESILEKRYQAESEPVQPGTPTGDATASRFEIKNVGTTLQIEPLVSPDGKSVTLSLSPQRVALLRMDENFLFQPKVGPAFKLPQPVFTTSKVTTTITLQDGERRLIYTGKAGEAGTHMELFIVGVKIIPAKK